MGSLATHRSRIVGVFFASTLAVALAAVAAATAAKTPPGAAVRHEKTVTAPAALVSAAKREGSVTFYTSAVMDQMNHLSAAFEKKYGVKVNAQAITTAPLATRLNAEVTAGNVTADVIDLADQRVTAGIADRGAFALLTDLPEFKTFPRHFKYKYFAIASIQAFGVGFNTQAVKPDELKSWKDIVNPKFKGRVQILDPRSIPVAQAFFVTLAKKYGDDFIRQIGELEPTLQISSTPLSQQVVSGEALIGFPMNPSTLPKLKAAGAPIGIAQPTPTTGPIHYVAVMKEAPHPNAARLFVNYLLSNTGQAAYNGYGFGSSPVRNIRGLSLPSGYVPPTPPPAAKVQRVIALLGLK